MKDTKALSGDNKGQFVIEAVLLMVISIMLFAALMKSFKEKQIVENILTKPWQKIAGMIENGVWADAASSKKRHPHNQKNVATLKQE